MEGHRKPPKKAPRAPRVKNVVSEADHQALQEAYSFLPNAADQNDDAQTETTSWQDRMVNNYHNHLYKEYALADLSRGAGSIGLRWRTQQEVKDGRGEISCGNKHCLKSKDYSSTNLQSLTSLEVPFAYQERGQKKKELVKLRLCPQCLPLVSTTKRVPIQEPEAAVTKYDSAQQSLASDSSTLSREKRRKKKRRNKKREERSQHKNKRRRKDDEET